MYRSWLEIGPPLPEAGPTPSARLVVSLFFIFASDRAKLETICHRKPAFVGIAILFPGTASRRVTDCLVLHLVIYNEAHAIYWTPGKGTKTDSTFTPLATFRRWEYYTQSSTRSV